ncbi:predicted protein [Histoplasma capsulatum G186AR]|uniref:Uncharacterized protein n=1 Tax=Ajellomyces capsulatus (strain G186AR / H82 / ATCC MYA-2454 / RMSCC 2432) TaxID=447093 RepID=C0P002_AJECG|nr:uncharacterized protein HCBG_08732 [Histoplasma capsulatum G186AR]EEH03092.1 predicted protein [Histoplasma capsulatum G186AR]
MAHIPTPNLYPASSLDSIYIPCQPGSFYYSNIQGLSETSLLEVSRGHDIVVRWIMVWTMVTTHIMCKYLRSRRSSGFWRTTTSSPRSTTLKAAEERVSAFFSTISLANAELYQSPYDFAQNSSDERYICQNVASSSKKRWKYRYHWDNCDIFSQKCETTISYKTDPKAGRLRRGTNLIEKLLPKVQSYHSEGTARKPNRLLSKS